jgi:hypothetical protein
MLDLLTLFAAFSVQKDLDQIRKEHGENIVEAEEDAPAASLDLVESVESGINAVENALSAAVTAVANVELCVPVIDLSLPTTLCAAK